THTGTTATYPLSYTTLFRSGQQQLARRVRRGRSGAHDRDRQAPGEVASHLLPGVRLRVQSLGVVLVVVGVQLFEHRLLAAQQIRSEEHTSELQSRENLVCRL